MPANERRIRALLAAAAELDRRYQPDAYAFVYEALQETVRSLRHHHRLPADGHVAPQQLLQGFAQLAQRRYGEAALTTLRSWGLWRTADVGHVVATLRRVELVAAHVLDDAEDFVAAYDFGHVFGRI